MSLASTTETNNREMLKSAVLRGTGVTPEMERKLLLSLLDSASNCVMEQAVQEAFGMSLDEFYF